MRSNNTLAPTVIIILSISAFVAVLAYAMWPTAKDFDVHLATVKPATQNANVNTASWQTYTNAQYGFNFQYPSGYTPLATAMTEERPRDHFVNDTKLLSDGVTKAEITMSADAAVRHAYPLMYMSVFPLDRYRMNDGVMMAEYGYDSTSHGLWQFSEGGAKEPSTLETVTGQGVNGYLLPIGDGPGGTNYIIFLSPSTNQAVELSFSYGCNPDVAPGQPEDCTQNMDIWKTIVSTFTFTK